MSGSADDPFGNIKREAAKGGGSANGVRARNAGRQVAPVPADAPARPAEHYKYGPPARWWTYRDAAGQVLGHVARFEGEDGKKVAVVPLTYRETNGRAKWEWKAFDEPRPLYGLRALAERPSAPVLLVEGEKTTDAASERFADFVVVSWPGGSKAIGCADWSPLAGREVVIFPDADAPGGKAAKDLPPRLRAAGAASVRVVKLPEGLPEGWDLADEWAAGFGLVEASAAITSARASAGYGEKLETEPEDVTWPYGFRMDSAGLWCEVQGRDGQPPALMRLSSPFKVLGEARDPDGGGWSVVLQFRDRDSREKTEIVPRGALASEPGSIRGRLASAGLFIAPQRGKAERFASCLAEVASSRRLTTVNATGWAPGNRFVLPTSVVGPESAEPVLFTGDPASLFYRKGGRLDAWRAEVAAKAPGNPLLVLALSIAFAGPLLRPLHHEGGGFHLRGPSSCGKTSLALAAGSVWGGGGPLGYAQSWRATSSALEMLGFGHSETLLVLDELGLVDPDEAGHAAYMLASGFGRGRSKTDGTLRRRAEFLTIFLSTGEIGLADHIRSGRRGERAMAGQELRLLDITADGGRGLGVWSDLHGHAGPAELSDHLKGACAAHYGHAGPVFVERYLRNPTEALDLAKTIVARFLKQAHREGDTGQVHRAAHRFALVAAAGELATTFGVVPWTPGEAFGAALNVFGRWASAFGRDAPREARHALRALKAAIEQQQSRFAVVGEDVPHEQWEEPASDRAGEARSLNTLGYRHTSGPDVYYLFHDAGWSEVLKGFDPKFAARVALEAGLLLKGDGDHLKRVKKIKGQPRRLYWIKSAILETDFDD